MDIFQLIVQIADSLGNNTGLLVVCCAGLCVILFIGGAVLQFIGGFLGIFTGIFEFLLAGVSGDPSGCGCLFIVLLMAGCGVVAFLAISVIPGCATPDAINLCTLLGY